jgi:hypothetical protein
MFSLPKGAKQELRRPLSLFVTEPNDSRDGLVFLGCPERGASIVILLNEANRTMDATCNFDLGFAQERVAKSETPNRLSNQQALQMISTGVSLVSLSLGFSIFGILIIVNQHQDDLNDFSGNGFLATIGGVSAILVGTVFLVAACLHWRFCLKHLHISAEGAPGNLKSSVEMSAGYGRVWRGVACDSRRCSLDIL